MEVEQAAGCSRGGRRQRATQGGLPQTSTLCTLPRSQPEGIFARDPANEIRHVEEEMLATTLRATRLRSDIRARCRLSTALLLRPLFSQHRHFAAASNLKEMGTVMDRYNPKEGYLKGWKTFVSSTMAVVQLRKVLDGWSVPKFKAEAGRIYSDVGAALANADEKRLQQLTTPSCLATMVASIRERPANQRQKMQTLSVNAKIRTVRIGYHASNKDQSFAQITTSIEAKVVWGIWDKKGKRVGGVGSEKLPHVTNDLIIFERCISDKKGSWKMKEKQTVEASEA